MKAIRSILILTVLFLSLSDVMGQISIQAGINAASWRASEGGITLDTDSRAGFHAGINYTTAISESFYFMPGIQYSIKGAKFFDIDATQNYIDIPLLFVYQPNIEKGFYGEGGPYIGFLLSADSEGIDIKDNYQSTDAGLVLGGGYDFGKIKLGLRGVIGITNISKETPGTSSEGKIVNSVGQIYFAVKM